MQLIYRNRNLTGTRTSKLVGFPSTVAGRNDHFRTARIAAASSKPLPELLTNETLFGRPSLSTATCRRTDPSTPARRAAAG